MNQCPVCAASGIIETSPVATRNFALAIGWLLWLTVQTSSAGVIITKDNTANALTDSSSWVGGTVPTSDDIALWDATASASLTNAWTLGASTNWAGISVASIDANKFINADGSTLTLGASGVDMSGAAADLNLNCNLSLASNQSWNIALGRTLNVNGSATGGGLTGSNHLITLSGPGSLSLGGNTAPVDCAFRLASNGQFRLGRTLSTSSHYSVGGNTSDSQLIHGQGVPFATNTITLADGVNKFGTIKIAGKTNELTIKAPVNSTNILGVGSIDTPGYYGVSGQGTFAIASGADASVLRVDGGHYEINGNNLDANGTGVGNPKFIFTNCTVSCNYSNLSSGGARNIAASVELQRDARLHVRFGRFSMANNDAQTLSINDASLIVDHSLGTSNYFGIRLGGDSGPAGTGFSINCGQTNSTVVVDSDSTGHGFDLGSASSGKTCNYTISGGSLTIYKSDGGTGGFLKLGAEAGGPGQTTFTMLNGCKVMVQNEISGSQVDANQVFDFQGGTLVAGGIRSANLRGSGDPANGTFKNNGGTLAPGDIGTAGRTLIYGNCTMSSGALAMDIGGTNVATTFQTNVPGFHDVLQVTANLDLGGELQVSLIEGYTPTPSNQFNIILVNTGGIISGTFANLTPGASLGRVAVANRPGASFSVRTNSQSTAIYLYDYSSGTPVASPPMITSFHVAAGQVTISGTNSPSAAGGSYHVLTSTNVALPQTDWTAVATNVFAADGGFTNVIPINPAETCRYYLLQVP